MSQFSYLAIRGGGQRVSGTLRSRDRHEAVRKLMEMGYHPLTIETAGNSTGGGIQFKHAVFLCIHRVRTIDLAVFTRQLASLLKAGLPVLQALSTLRKQVDHKGLVRVIEDMEASIGQDAMSLGEALAEHPKVFDPVYRGLVRSGEESGRLVEVLENLADHLSKSAKLRGQVLGAFIYPIFLLLIGTTAIFVLMTCVIPKFQELFDSLGQQLPLPTIVLIAISGFLENWWWAVVGGLTVAVLAGMAALRHQHLREQVDRTLLRLPVLGGMFLKLEVARVAHTLAALLQGGVRIIEALRVTGETARNTAIRRTFEPMTQAVSTGQTLAEAVEKAKVYPPMVLNLIRTGEDTGELPEMLQELAAIYEDEAERAVNGAVKLLEPTLIVVMGLIIAGIVAAVILPIFHSSAIIG